MTKFAAKGTIFQIETSTPLTFAPVAQVSGISGPSLQQDSLDVSCHDSYNASTGVGGYRAFVSGFKDAGEITLALRFDPAEDSQSEAADGLLDYYNSGVIKNMQIIWPNVPDLSEWDFQGIITGYTPDAPFDDVLTAEITIKLTGAPVFVATPV